MEDIMFEICMIILKEYLEQYRLKIIASNQQHVESNKRHVNQLVQELEKQLEVAKSWLDRLYRDRDKIVSKMGDIEARLSHLFKDKWEHFKAKPFNKEWWNFCECNSDRNAIYNWRYIRFKMWKKDESTFKSNIGQLENNIELAKQKELFKILPIPDIDMEMSKISDILKTYPIAEWKHQLRKIGDGWGFEKIEKFIYGFASVKTSNIHIKEQHGLLGWHGKYIYGDIEYVFPDGSKISEKDKEIHRIYDSNYDNDEEEDDD